ncbi:MAG TPA: hypothetical protein VN042_00720, partial [Asticcacaulis sp.]|nr:hypothetical protein [Asticcacaulis sp.]
RGEITAGYDVAAENRTEKKNDANDLEHEKRRPATQKMRPLSPLIIKARFQRSGVNRIFLPS